MNLNYHEMTMNEPRDSPQKRKQFLVICSVMVTALSYAVMTSGVMLPLEAQEGIFPGGNFCYKLAHRDYAASMGLGRRITSDVTGIKFPTNTESKPVEEILYHLYLDNPLELSGRRLRWASGILVGDSSQDKVEKLMALNAKGKRYPTPEEFADLSASEVMEMYPYELVDLPSVDSLVAQFPNTHGFVSALVMSYKIIPTMRKLAKEKGADDAVVLATCRKFEEMCTLYAPLVQTKDFLLGQLDPETYKAGLPADALVSWDGTKQGMKKFFPFLKDYIDKLPF